jgi:hypothetical protein
MNCFSMAVATVGGLYRKKWVLCIYVRFLDYCKHNILNQIRLDEMHDSLPECTPGDLLGQ